MIKAHSLQSNPIKVRLTSTLKNTAVIVTKYSNCWIGVYESNGARFDKQSYREILDHLEARGW